MTNTLSHIGMNKNSKKRRRKTEAGGRRRGTERHQRGKEIQRKTERERVRDRLRGGGRRQLAHLIT